MTHVSFLRALRRSVARGAMLALLLMTPPGTAVAVEPGVGEGGPPATALVRVDGHTILRVRGFAGLPAQERARAIEGRIVDLARSRAETACLRS